MIAVRRLLHWLYPLTCVACRQPAPARLCLDCLEAWPPLPAGICAACAHRHGPDVACPTSGDTFQGVWVAACHAGVARQAVHALKYRRQRCLARELAARMLASMPADARGAAWTVVPIPLHSRRRRERGYDQAALLARALARAGGWSYARPLRRTRATRPSPGLDRAARQTNMAGAFTCSGVLPRTPILLVDDVLTTGATAEAAGAALRAAGANVVALAVVARTL